MTAPSVVPGRPEPSPSETWARICRATGLQARTLKLGSEMNWQEFADLAEAAIGLCLHERSVALRRAATLAAENQALRGVS